ncbi:MAG: hypothetical protein ACE15D_15055 [Candidatus Eisenbacteria bacterium]
MCNKKISRLSGLMSLARLAALSLSLALVAVPIRALAGGCG